MSGGSRDSLKTYHQESVGKTQLAVARLIRPGSRVLEVGCATGYFTRYLSQEMGCRVTAVEINPSAAEQAAPFAERMIVGDITDPAVWNQAGQRFDSIIFADVLEHLADPGAVLKRCLPALTEGGGVVASIPNVAYYKIRKELLLGRWDYTDSGIMDDSHLRFFTRKTVMALFRASGYTVDRLDRVYRAKTDWRLRWLCPDAFTYQFVVRALPQ
ncbi:MAG: hypothetical protein KatS3mg024_1870 [Armatimonadota bacterium]|nr:MAG: hypothetical protein KatS3mg024_1870 [Armatimonadota bacterium]